MKKTKLVHVTNEMVPTIVAFDPQQNRYMIGSDARLTGINGKTSIFNFKLDFGEGDRTFGSKKKYWYYYPDDSKSGFHIDTLSAKEAAEIFLGELLSKVPQPEELVVGEPAVREKQWKENFRSHMREVLSDLGHSGVSFFPEPFAVFQYYRHIEGIFPSVTRPQNVLVVDIGGGTFNSCLIRTTARGSLARGGSTAVPLGLQAETFGGSEVDRQLLQLAIKKAEKSGITWKDDPMERAEKVGMPVLLLVEDAKISLSKQIGPKRRLSQNVSEFKHQLKITKGTLHPETDIDIEWSGEEFKSILRSLWRKTWGPSVIKTINEAREKLKRRKINLDRIDLVLVAGGSAQLPYTDEEINILLPTLTDPKNIYIGKDAGTAVSLGIAWECKEQSAKDPRLSVGKIAPCVLNDLYVGFKRSRHESFEIPKIRWNGKLNKKGQLLSSPFETEELIIDYELEIPFVIKDKLYYYFSDSPLERSKFYLNHMNDVLTTQLGNRVSRKIGLSLAIKRDGSIKPTFLFQQKGKGAKKGRNSVECPEFFIDNFSLIEGESFCGIDFGTSNSYVSRFIAESEEDVGVIYPSFELPRKTTNKLRLFEQEIESAKNSGDLNPKDVLKRAKEQTLSIIFHSNKIEGNPLTKGETEEAIEKHEKGMRLSKNDREAANMETAYLWVLEHFSAVRDEPLTFIRHLNKLTRQGIDRNAGEYRKKEVSISGVGYVPPPSPSISHFMNMLGDEIKGWADGRSVIEFAASIHTKLVWIHPFEDGNGRTARLLLNTILLCENLPVIVVNYADKSRYIAALEESNHGNIGSLVDFLLECFEEEVEYFKEKRGGLESDLSDAGIEKESVLIRSEEDPEIIAEAIAEVSLRDQEDPLSVVLEQKAEVRLKKEEATFEAAMQSFATLLSETKAVAEMVDANPKYKYLGFSVKVKEYDVIDFDKYLAALSGGKIPNTWYFGVEVVGPSGSEKLLLAFDKSERTGTRGKYDIALHILRFDGQEYRKLSSEPILLRYVCYHNGNLMFVHNDESIVEGRVRHEVSLMIAEVIKGYL